MINHIKNEKIESIDINNIDSDELIKLIAKYKREIDLYYRSLLYKYDRIYLYNASFKEKDLNKFSTKELNINSFSQEMIKWELPAIAKLYKELTNSDKDISQQNPNIALTEDINTNTPQIKKNKGNYIGCTTIEELKSYIDKALLKENLIIAFDTETDSLITTEANLVGFSLSYEAGTGLYVPLIFLMLRYLFPSFDSLLS